MQTFIIGANGMEPVNTTPKFQIGEPVYQSRTGYTYYVVCDQYDQYGFGQKAIRFDEEEKQFVQVYADTQSRYRSRTADGITPLTQEQCQSLIDGYIQQEQERSRQQEDKERIEKETIAKGKEWLAKNTPAGAVAVIIADYHEDKSDPMSDYFGHSVKKQVVLAWSFKKKNDFAEMRAAAKLFPETAHLGAYNKDMENREDYSGGHGYYLGTYKHNTGWKVRKLMLTSYFTGAKLAGMGEEYFLPMKQPQPIHNEPQTATAGSGITVELNEEFNGIEIRFSEKPEPEVIAKLKAHSFRWHMRKKMWYAKQTPSRLDFANKLSGE